MNDVARRTTPIGMIRYAKDFRDASLAADDQLGKKEGFEIIAPIPVMYLIAHSMELSIKAFLLFKGVEMKDLKKYKKYGHDIMKCLKKAKELGIENIVEITDLEEGSLEVLNNLYHAKELNYIVSGYKQFPMFGPLQTLSSKLILEVGREVGYPVNRLV